MQGLDRGRKHAVQKGRRKECVCVCVCVIERGRGVGAEQERCVYVWRGYGEGAEGECKSGGEMGGEKSVAQRKTGLLTSQ